MWKHQCMARTIICYLSCALSEYRAQMLNSTNWIQYPQITSGLHSLGCHGTLVLLLCFPSQELPWGSKRYLGLPSVISSQFQYTGASRGQGNRKWHCCLWQSPVQYRSPFYHGGYLWEVSKDALNFPPKFCERPSETEPSWRLDGTPDLHKCTSVLRIQRDNEERCFTHAGWRHWDYILGLIPSLM